MVGTCLRSKTSMNQTKLIKSLSNKHPAIAFQPASSYCWSPKEQTVYYQEKDASEVGLWTLLHEVSHGLLNHTTYQSDFELVLLEMKAWQEAERLAKNSVITIDPDHIQDCLDSYRDWQYKRSLCPTCGLGGVQIDQKTYHCLFCSGKWHVSEARFCRPYRKKVV